MNKPRGFALILSVMIIGTVLLLIAIASSRVLTAQLTSSVSLQNHLTAKYLAEGCAEKALAALAEDAFYAGAEDVIIGTNTCTIEPVTFSESLTVIQTSATIQTNIYRLQVELSSLNPPTVSSWQRVAEF